MSKTQHQHQPNQPSCHPGKKEIDIFFWGSLFFVSVLFILAFIDTPSQPWLTTLSLSVYHMVHSIWWGVAIGALFIGLLSKVPREFILSILGKGVFQRIIAIRWRRRITRFMLSWNIDGCGKVI